MQPLRALRKGGHPFGRAAAQAEFTRAFQAKDGQALEPSCCKLRPQFGTVNLVQVLTPLALRR